jgi:hypothetical protein
MEMLRISRQPLAAKGEISRRSGLLLHEGFDEFSDLLLLAARQLRRGFKHHEGVNPADPHVITLTV